MKKTPKNNFKILLFAVLLTMFFLATFFSSCNRKQGKKDEKILAKKENQQCIKIAYVNQDTLMFHYTLFNDLKSSLEAKTTKMQQELERREKSLQEQFIAYQKKAQSGNISYDDAQKTEQSLAKQQQDLMILGEQYTKQINEEEIQLVERILDSVNVVLKIINKDHQYDYILGYTQGAGILYANPEYNITFTVLDILNKRYKQNSKKPKK